MQKTISWKIIRTPDGLWALTIVDGASRNPVTTTGMYKREHAFRELKTYFAHHIATAKEDAEFADLREKENLQ